jgi:hypothetical protein
MVSKGFFRGLIAGLILAGLSYLHTPIATEIAGSVMTVSRGITSSQFLALPIIFGLIGWAIKR